MKVSTKGRYGLRAVIDIAMFSETEPTSLGDIAVRQNLPISYLEQLAAKLRKAGIINSIRGAKGGYSLAKPAGQISVGEVLRALEGNLDPVDCAEITGAKEACSGSDLCVTKYVWKRISDSINDTVNTLMLSELIEESERLTKENEGKPEQKKLNQC